MMRMFQTFVRATILLLFFSSTVVAADFDWVGDFNTQARADYAGFKGRLAARFEAGDEQISAVLCDVSKPSDAYMVFRLGEISRQPMDRVMAEYKFSRRKGWSVIAKRLGISSGSKEFRALKSSQDLYGGRDPENGKGENRGKSL